MVILRATKKVLRYLPSPEESLGESQTALKVMAQIADNSPEQAEWLRERSDRCRGDMTEWFRIRPASRAHPSRNFPQLTAASPDTVQTGSSPDYGDDNKVLSHLATALVLQ